MYDGFQFSGTFRKKPEDGVGPKKVIPSPEFSRRTDGLRLGHASRLLDPEPRRGRAFASSGAGGWGWGCGGRTFDSRTILRVSNDLEKVNALERVRSCNNWAPKPSQVATPVIRLELATTVRGFRYFLLILQ